MLLGFNHNIMYKGEVFHVQTEDSGTGHPNIVTLLYKDGVILGSIKITYADILMMENFEQVVEEFMKEQHKQMMRRLKSGEFDERIASLAKSPVDNPPETSDTLSNDADLQETSSHDEISDSSDVSEPPRDTNEVGSQQISAHDEAANKDDVLEFSGDSNDVAPDDAEESPAKHETLDDAILSFFGLKKQ